MNIIKKGSKKIIALILLIALVAPMMFSQNAYASETEVQEPAAIASDETVADEAVVDEAAADEPTVDEATPDQGTEPQGETKAVTNSVANLPLNYLAVEYPEVAAAAEQAIAISIGEGNEALTNLKLNVENEAGNIESLECTEQQDDLYKFTRVYSNEELGVYNLVSIEYTLNEEVYSINLGDLEIQASYTVVSESEEDSEELLKSIASSNAEEIVEAIQNSVEATETTEDAGYGLMSSRSAYGNSVVVLDPGHGGSDGGASGNGVKESDANLKIAKYCRDALKNYPGITVYMTRETDVFVSLSDRSKFAKDKGADLFVSFHNNSSGSSSPNGTEVYYPNGNDNKGQISEEGKYAAQEVQNALVALGMGNRGIKKYDDVEYQVIRECKSYGIPAILIEHAFISNASDASKLRDEAWLKKFGEADAKGIANYFIKYPGQGTPLSTSIVNKNNFAGTFGVRITGTIPSGDDLAVALINESTNTAEWTELKSHNTGNGSLINYTKNGGNYRVDVYRREGATGSGKHILISSTKVDMTKTTFTSSVTETSAAQTAFRATTTLTNPQSEITSLRYAVWSESNGQDDLKWYIVNKSGNTYTTQINISDYKNLGKYNIHTYAYMNNGLNICINKGTFQVKSPTANVAIGNQSSNGSFNITVSNIVSPYGVNEILVPVWPTSNRNKLHWYKARKQSNGSYVATVNLANHDYIAGAYKIDTYVKDTKGFQTCVNSVTKNIVKPDVNLNITKSSNEKTVALSLANPEVYGSLRKVMFAVWSVDKGQDDLIWYDSSKSGNNYNKTITVASHKSKGQYKIDAYVTLSNGKQVCVKSGTFDISSATATVAIGAQNSAYNAPVTVSSINSKSGIDRVQVAAWSKSNQSDLAWYTATRQSNGSYVANINPANHGYSAGAYKVDTYVKDGNGFMNCVNSSSVNLVRPEVQFSATKSANEKTVALSLSNAEIYGGIRKVMYAVWSLDKGQDDLIWYDSAKSGNSYNRNITVASHKSKGQYKVDVYVTLSNGNQVCVKSGNFDISSATATVNIGTQNASYIAPVTISNINSKSGIDRVQVAAWSKSNQSDLVWYTATRQSNGSYIVNLNPANHGYSAGAYKVDTYVKDGNGFMNCVNSSSVNLARPEAQFSLTKSADDKTVALSLSNAEIYGTVRKVMYAVWSVDKGQDDLIWYDSAKSGSAYNKTITVASHNSSGAYKVDAYITLSNGTQMCAKSGTFNIGTPTAALSLDNYSSTTGNFTANVTNVASVSGVTKVQLAVWSTANQSDLKWYTANKTNGTTYTYTISPSSHNNNSGNYKVGLYIIDGNGFQTGIVQKNIDVVAPPKYAIMGSSTITVSQMVNFYNANKPAAASFDRFYKYGTEYDGVYKKSGVNSIEDFARLYIEECQAEGVKVEVAFTQVMLETGFLNFGNDVKPDQYNFAGIGATGGGVPGHSFDTVRIGIRAQIQHLKGYASTEKLNNACVDPRYDLINPKGKAPFVEGLAGTWAADPNYAIKLLNYIDDLKKR